MDGTSPLGGNTSNVPAEIIELRHPIRVERYGFVPDSGGAGRHRGGVSIERQMRFLGRHGMLQIRSDRRRFRPYGLLGGESGAPSSNLLNPGTDAEIELPTKFTRPIQHGDVILHRTAGGGGYGSAGERAPEAIAADLLDGKLTAEAARDSYGWTGAQQDVPSQDGPQ